MIGYGGDYYPEQWSEEVWAEDVRLMLEAGVNLVSLGVFAWSRIQSDEGEWDFAWLDRILDLLGEAGIGVNLATATASIPQWAVRRYPDIVPVTADGVPLGPGSRQHYSPTSPDYRRLAARLVERIGTRYAAHPAVRMWHVNNEYACHVHADYSDHAAVAFRAWLERRYGDVDTLNRTWGTTFWSQRYGSFDEIQPPRRAPYSLNPGGLLDFRRFTSDSILELYMMERDILRAAGATQPITTNFMGAFEPLDYWRWAQEVDVIADDSYPDPADPASFRAAAFTRDLMRSLKPGTPWILMEQAANAVNWRQANAFKAPGQMAALSDQALARGAGSIMFFQWRQSVRGSEKFHSAMLPHAGTATRTWSEVVEYGSSLRERDVDLPPAARVAIVVDWENWWALDQPDHPATIDYLAEIQAWYSALHAGHVFADIVRADHDLAGYDLVIAPALYLLTEAGAASLRSFVARGGTLVTTAFTDVVDEQDAFRPGGFAVQLREVFGGYPVDFEGLPADGDAASATRGIREEFVVTTGSEVTDPAVTSVLGGRAVLVRNPYGDGLSLHVTTLTDQAGAACVLDVALASAGVSAPIDGLPNAVEAVPTTDGVVLINQQPDAVTVQLPGRTTTLGGFAVERVSLGAADR
ncbi:beta-galactosidase [Planctomonas sp. JC2975]|uniref:beta-galactosidase n=1 Tax=Planctomonas sp. JC2975 TaxID=2729626 RepID=UPI0014751612|nr:beta-galactosidase [Planctomonas sp. JC2975]